LNFDEEEHFIIAMRELIHLERELEHEKIKLANMTDFNLMDAFMMVDYHMKKWITTTDLREALEDFGIFPHKEDVCLFLRQFDQDNDGRLQYSDFCDAFCPKDRLSAQVLN